MELQRDFRAVSVRNTTVVVFSAGKFIAIERGGLSRRPEEMLMSWCEQNRTLCQQNRSVCFQNRNSTVSLWLLLQIPVERFHSGFASAEDRALRGRNLSAA
jgi:hypothetical protein